MINIKYLTLFSLFFLSSCAGSLRVSLKNCPNSSAQFAQITGKDSSSFHPDHSFTTKFWSYGISYDSPSEVDLKDVLTDNGFNCENIKYIRYTLGQSSWDQMFSIVPFVQRSSIKIEVAMKDGTTN